MDAVDSGAVVRRLEKLERQNRLLKIAGIGALVLVPLLILSCGGAKDSTADFDDFELEETTEAKSFLVVDEEGRSRAELAWRKVDDSVELVLYDESEAARAEFFWSTEHAGLSFQDDSARTRALCSLSPDGADLLFYGENGKTRLRLSLSDDSTSLGLFDQNGNTRVELSSFEDGAGLTLCDQNGKRRAKLFLKEDGSPALQLLDKDGKVIWQAPAATE